MLLKWRIVVFGRRKRIAVVLAVVVAGGTVVAGAAQAGAAQAGAGRPGRACTVAKSVVLRHALREIARCTGREATGRGMNDAAVAETCRTVAVADAAVELAAAEAQSAAAGYTCPGDPTTLGLAGDGQWLPPLVRQAVVADNPLPNKCVRRRIAAVGKYAAKHAGCVVRMLASKDPSALEGCASRAVGTMERRWVRSEGAKPCVTDDPTAIAEAAGRAVERAFDAFAVVCGDGQRGGFEQCDDGNSEAADGCENDCTITVACGNGRIEPRGGEQCDDANTVAGDGCDEVCVREECGNARVQTGEQCDAGGPTASCDADCTLAECGDALVNVAAGETCDEGGDTETCDRDCTDPACGDGLDNAAAGEQCDGGGDTPLCNADCTEAVCGDGIVNPQAGELCDDGPESVECDADCTEAVCGDGLVNETAGEQCDDGALVTGDGCNEFCERESCVPAGPACAACPDGTVPDAEQLACVCPPGTEADGPDCVDIDECALGTDECPDDRPCVNVEGSYACAVPCTQAGLEDAIAACGAPSGVITFDCRDTVIKLPNVVRAIERETECNDLVIDGLDRNVTFELDPPCYEVPLPPEDCRVEPNPDGTCDCPDINNGTGFLSLDGRRSTARNLTVRAFFEGIRTDGINNTVENVVFDRMCDDAFGTNLPGVGNLFRDITVTDGCGKCSQSFGDVADTSADPTRREHYNGIFRDIEMRDCEQPFRTTEGGRYLIERATMIGGAEGLFACVGPRFSSTLASELFVTVRDSELTGCNRGLRFGGDAEGIVENTTITSSAVRGLLVKGSARVSASGNVIVGNGGTSSSEPGLGGVAVTNNALADLGGGLLTIDGQQRSSPGNNVLCNNIDQRDDPRDVDNQTAVAVSAENNYWCSPDPASLVAGVVDVNPFLNNPPAGFTEP